MTTKISKQVSTLILLVILTLMSLVKFVSSQDWLPQATRTLQIEEFDHGSD